MITIYFGNDNALNESIRPRLENYQIVYQQHTSADIDFSVLMNLFSKTADMFELLNSSLIRYKLDSRLTISQFILKILNNVEKSLKLPIAITDTAIYSGLTPEEVLVLLPKECRKAERENLFRKLERLDEGKMFWKNFESLRKQSELRWFELNELLFADVSDDLGEIKKAKDHFFSYKKNKQVPPDEIIEKILKIFLVDREDFFKKSPSDLQNF
ncbi:hypothetical protein [Streptococcus halichoeri]|uniref:hypothetical protein n=1 Tax=Streptococcus halichoeri TaxID=254785 RepID=UPI001356A8C1|nr:hypothetical protein [Streptococcus halichoeri]